MDLQQSDQWVWLFINVHVMGACSRPIANVAVFEFIDILLVYAVVSVHFVLQNVSMKRNEASRVLRLKLRKRRIVGKLGLKLIGRQ